MSDAASVIGSTSPPIPLHSAHPGITVENDCDHIHIPRHGFASADLSAIEDRASTSASGYCAIVPPPATSRPRNPNSTPYAGNTYLETTRLHPGHYEAAERALHAFVVHLFYAFIALLAVACAYRPMFLFTATLIFLLGKVVRRELIKVFLAAGVLHIFLFTLPTSWLKAFASPKLVPLVVVGFLGLSMTAAKEYLTDEAPAISWPVLAFALLVIATFEGNETHIPQQNEDEIHPLFDAYDRHPRNDQEQGLPRPYDLHARPPPLERRPWWARANSGFYNHPARRSEVPSTWPDPVPQTQFQQPSPPGTTEGSSFPGGSCNRQKPVGYIN